VGAASMGGDIDTSDEGAMTDDNGGYGYGG
jgi:hypothetical protein